MTTNTNYTIRADDLYKYFPSYQYYRVIARGVPTGNDGDGNFYDATSTINITNPTSAFFSVFSSVDNASLINNIIISKNVNNFTWYVRTNSADVININFLVVLNSNFVNVINQYKVNNLQSLDTFFPIGEVGILKFINDTADVVIGQKTFVNPRNNLTYNVLTSFVSDLQ